MGLTLLSKEFAKLRMKRTRKPAQPFGALGLRMGQRGEDCTIVTGVWAVSPVWGARGWETILGKLLCPAKVGL